METRNYKNHPSWISVNVTSYKQTLFAKTSKIKKDCEMILCKNGCTVSLSINHQNESMFVTAKSMAAWEGTGAENRTQSMGHNRADWCNSLYATLRGFCRSVVPAGYLFMDIVQRE